LRRIPTAGAVGHLVTLAKASFGDRNAIKQVAAVTVEEQNEIVVVTVYTFYF
jgi:hypothetical protein